MGGHNLAPPKLNTPFTPTLNIGGTGRGEPDTKKNWPSERLNVKSGGEGGRSLHHIKVVQDCGHPLSAEFGHSPLKNEQDFNRFEVRIHWARKYEVKY